VAPLDVVFSSAGSSDSDGTIASYDWDFGDLSPHSSAANPAHQYLGAGSYVATLTVTDDKGATGQNSVMITVASNVAPTAVAGVDKTSGVAPLDVVFSSAGSSDSDGTIASYDWDFGDGSPHSNVDNPSHTYTAAGSYTATLTVTDDKGAVSVPASVAVTVASNVAPTAVAGADQTSGAAPLDVTFSSAGSSDTDGTIVSYDWDFGDGTAHSNVDNPTHTYTAAGSFTATLTVTDDKGATGTATVAITTT
jgi:PKD repeat protein